MRKTAGAIRAELEETRAEIKKGVFELPMEAKESTTAIRRAVSEQINALKELSEIVAKSGRNNDVSEPRRRRVRRSARAAPGGSAALLRRARRAAPPSGSAPQQQAPRRSPSARPAGRPRLRHAPAR